MPIYEYRCERCEQLSEFFLRVSEPHPESCPRCGEAGALRKQISQTSFALKGEGWYVTDYKKSPGAKAEAKPEEVSSASASAGEAKAGGDGGVSSSSDKDKAAAAPAASTSAAGEAGTASAGKDSSPAGRGADRSSGSGD